MAIMRDQWDRLEKNKKLVFWVLFWVNDLGHSGFVCFKPNKIMTFLLLHKQINGLCLQLIHLCTWSSSLSILVWCHPWC